MRMKILTGTALVLTAGLALALAGPSHAQQKAGEHGHTHSHDHSHDHGADKKKDHARGIFEDSDVEARPLTDWEGSWQSVYPYLTDGTLDPVMAHKAEHGSKTAEEYRAYYETGYKTDVSQIEIEGGKVSFTSPSGVVSGDYVSDGHEILTYKAGNRGVRFVFKKTAGDAGAPAFIQFSDHIIAPQKAGHYHLYWGDDRAALLQEVTHWPTYYPAGLTGAEVQAEMLAH